MTFLDHTYFDGEIYLPFLLADSGTVGQSARNQYRNTNRRIDYFIAKYEPEFMRRLLGYELYNNFITGMQAESPLQVWIDLKNEIFKAEGKEQFTFNFSPAANFVYFYIIRQSQTVSTGKGEAMLTNSTGEPVSPYLVMMNAWNNMSDQVNLFYCNFLYPNWDKYKSFGCKPCHNFGYINELGI